MFPALKDSETARILPVSSKLHIGKIYAFRLGRRIMAHRFVRVYKGKAIFIGDRNSHFESIPADNIIGQIESNQSKSSFCLIVIMIINCIFVYLLMRIRYLRNLKKKLVYSDYETE